LHSPVKSGDAAYIKNLEMIIMIDISVHELNKYYGSNHVIKGITFEIYNGEKVGLLGKNGSGKTTLFKIIAEDEPYDSGSVSKATGKKVEILAQIPTFDENDTVEDILCSSFKEVTEIHDAMKKIEDGSFSSQTARPCDPDWSFASQTARPCDPDDGTPAVLAKYGQLMEEYERLGGYEIETKIEKISTGMNIGENMRKSLFSLLSGGEKTRVNLARILLRDCDILLLDEPTNHLDLASLTWLEGFIKDFPGTVVVISHDRAFLDNVINRIIELDSGTINFYTGNYSFYVEEKHQRFLTQAEQYKQQQRKISQLETAIKRQKVWADINPSNTGLSKRIVAMEKRIEQMDKVEKPATSKKMTEDFNSGGYAAKEAVSLDTVRKAYGPKLLLDDISLSISRNDRIALIGPNGCGKTTLIKLIMNEEPSDSGIIKVSSNIKIGYMSQIIAFENEAATVLDTLRNAIGLPEDKLRSILARFNFKALDVIKKVANLSGGEKSRLKLCLLMQNQINFLILDEPTNHLDISSREWIEDAVQDFNGTMLFISHDRYFLNKFASKIWSMNNGSITIFDGGFEDYLQITAISQSQSSPPSKATSKKKKTSPIKKPKPVIAYETQIYEAEAQLESLNEDIDLASFNYEEVNQLYQKKQQLEEHISTLYDQWAKDSQTGGDGNE